MGQRLQHPIYQQTLDTILGMREWRHQHPKATLREMEVELDTRWARLRARMLGALALESTAAQWRDQPPSDAPRCPHCGGVLEDRGDKPRHLRTTGDQTLTLERSYGWCRTCQVGVFPLDDELDLLAGQLTPQLQEHLARLSTWMPFAQAAKELAAFTGVVVHASTARRTTAAAGAAAVALQTAEVAELLQTLPDPPACAEPVVVSVDGAMVPLLGGQSGEVRTLAVGTPQATTDAHGQQVVATTNLSYFSRLTDSATFAHLATGELQRRGVAAAPRVAGVVDGAEWCQSVLDLHVPAAVRILDFPHAAGYVSTIGETVGARGQLLEGNAGAQVLQDLKHNGRAEVLARLRAAVASVPDDETASKALAYVVKRAAQMAYPRFQTDGWPIGSVAAVWAIGATKGSLRGARCAGSRSAS